MATNTEKLNLKKPGQDDFYNVNDFNENFEKIDEFAKGMDETLEDMSNSMNEQISNIKMPKKVSDLEFDATVPIEKGGTGATTAQNAIENLGGVKKSGDIITGDLIIEKGKAFALQNKDSYPDAVRVTLSDGVAAFQIWNDAENYKNRRYLEITARGHENISENCDPKDALRFVGQYTSDDGSYRWEFDHPVYHKGNLPYPTQIQTGSYVGTGSYGKNTPNMLTFPFKPKIVFIHATSNTVESYHAPTPLIYGCGTARINFRVDESSDRCYSDAIYLTWNDNTLYWYSTNTTYKEKMQLNANGITYNWVAIG